MVAAGEENTVHNAAVDAMKRAGGDRQRATSLLAAAVRTQPALKRAILDPLIEYACAQAIGTIARHDRQTVWSPPAPVRSDMSEADKVRLIGASNLLIFPLPIGGKTLGEATRDEIRENAEFYGKQAADMSHKARWLQLIAQSVPAKKTVAQVLSSDRLRELQEAARNA